MPDADMSMEDMKKLVEAATRERADVPKDQEERAKYIALVEAEERYRGKMRPETHEQLPILGLEGSGDYGFVYVLKGAVAPGSILRAQRSCFVIEAAPERWEPKTREQFLHVLRNPYGHSEQNIRAARLWAADQIDPPPYRATESNRAGGDSESCKKADLSTESPCISGDLSTGSHRLAPTETDTKLLAAHTPGRYAGDYPPTINLTMVRMKGDVVLTVRAPTVHGGPPGEVSCVRFTREQWLEFSKLVEPATRVFRACDELDAML